MCSRFRKFEFFLIFLCIFFCAQISYAGSAIPKDSQEGEAGSITHTERLSLARDFVAKLKSGLSRADEWLYPDKQLLRKEETESNILSEGELLLMQPVLKKNFRPDGVIFSRMHNGEVVLSLRDFADILRLAINVDPDGQNASGWYIREAYPFSLNLAEGSVSTANGSYNVSENVSSEQGDIFVPVHELALWLGFEMDVKISYQELKIESKETLPVQEEQERKNKKYTGYELASPRLPLGGETYTKASVPVVDVTTRSTYRKQNTDESSEHDHQANIKTVGDFARGTLTTQSVLNNRDQLARSRVTYERDSLEGNLLGSLKAKHIEVGDVRTVNAPIGGSVRQEFGMRVTNTDPTRNFTRASTVISGNAIPGWDVELYRNTQFLGLVNIGDDGFYRFEDITLFSDNNNFRLVFYGPQGERHEETVFVPYDKDMLTQGEGIYDISVSFNGQNTYVKKDLKNSDEDRGSVNLAALYEKPLTEGLTGSVGFQSKMQDSRRNYVGSAGLSWIQKQALINLDAAVDNEGDGAAEFSVRRDFGNHEINLTSEWRGAEFDDDSSSTGFDDDTFENRLTINGPILVPDYSALSARYNSSISHKYESGGDSLTSSLLGLNLGYKNVAFSGDVRHQTGSSLDDDRVDSAVNLNVSQGINRLRLTGNYQIQPESEFESFTADYTRKLTKQLELGLNVSKNIEQSLTDYQARLDWQAGFIRISPSVRYNSNDDFFAGVNTRFGLIREPISGDIKMYDRTISNNAFVSAHVYLDKNGDGEFNGDDENLPEVIVKAPQNGRRAVTNEKGVALFDRMTDLRLSDVFIDQESLQDPAWIPGFEGVSILPRHGYVAQIEFPVHMSGELDGTVYANVVPLPEEAVAQIEPASGVAPEEGQEEASDAALAAYGQELIGEGRKQAEEVAKQAVVPRLLPLRNIELLLYSDKGEVEQRSTTDYEGFYYFSNIPPGRYYLMISEKSAQRKNIIRPKPQPIEITYEGTVIYDNKIFVDTGEGDVPSEMLADLNTYKERHPHIHFADEDYDLVLNLGEYNSQLLMSLVWYRLRTHFGEVFGDKTDPMVPPAESFANIETGKHSLRVAVDRGKTLDEAYAMCRSLMAREQYCKVEIYPSYMKHAEEFKIAKLSADAKVEEGSKAIEDHGLPKAEAAKEGDPVATGGPIDLTGDVMDVAPSSEEGEADFVEADDRQMREEALEEELYEEYEDDFIVQDRFTPSGEYKNVFRPSTMIVPSKAIVN